MLTNYDLSLAVFSFLKQVEVETLIVCAGARNAPLVIALQGQSFKIFNYFEERSAAFFAIGLIKSSHKPVAILTTSGTAVAELLPATIEAYYQGLPLILITADRPKMYRGTGAPQAIEQLGIFSKFVDAVYDLDVMNENFNFKWTYNKPIHLNIAFDEPLLDQKSDLEIQVSVEKISNTEAIFLEINNQNNFKHPVIVLGEIPLRYHSLVHDFLAKGKYLVYAESLSQFKNSPVVLGLGIHSSDNLLKHIFKMKLCDSVVRIGGVPTLRFWRDLEFEFKDIPVVSYTDLPFSGLARKSDVRKFSDLNNIKLFSEEVDSQSDLQEKQLSGKSNEINLQLKKYDQNLQEEKIKLFKKYPLSEQNFTYQLSRIVKLDPLYIGNSLPIRNWDCFAECKSKIISANRGANGIDGQISTYLGWSEEFDKSFCYIGDLTALYDLAALGLKAQLNQHQRHIVVMNNFGGQIFKRVFKNDQFINGHSTQFYHWAKMWDWDYSQISDPAELTALSNLTTKFNVIEILPNAEQTQQFWNEWDEKCLLKF